MKRVFFSTLFSLMIIVSAQAQYDTEIDLGLRLKMTRTTLNLTDGLADFTDGGHDTGYQLGAFLQIRVNHIYIQPEIVFADTKSTLTSPNVANIWDNVQVDFDFQSVEIPLMIGYRAGIGDKLAFRVGLGPVISLLLNTSTDISTTTTGVAPPQLADGVDDAFNSAALHGRAGVGLDIGPFIFDLKYEYGLSKLYEEILIAGQGESVKKQNEWIVGVGYKIFRIKK